MAKRRTRATVWLGLALGLACVALFTRNAPWREIGAVLAGADVPTILAASVCLLMTSVARAWRWRQLLAGAPVSFRHRLTSTLIGFAGNNTLPGRLGEPLRCWVVTRLDGRIGFWQAAGSIVVERVFDLGAALVLLVVFLVAAPFPPGTAVRDAAFLSRLRGEALIAGSLAAVAALGLVLFARRRLATDSGRRGSLGARLASLQAGIAGLRSGRSLGLAVFFTAVLWGSMVAFELLMLRAFGFTELGLPHAVGLLVVLSFAIALPQAPAGVGVVQLASETTLTALYGMPVDRAKAFAIGLWICQVAVVVSAGAVALWAEGLSLADMRRARSAVDAFDQTPSPG
ncbi:MAG: flippase-like domain-containing protein [Deltaproteobacteria bacterium]|nr:flippase-like domain-containing protein [Deltaproteobacteria bacterium]